MAALNGEGSLEPFLKHEHPRSPAQSRRVVEPSLSLRIRIHASRVAVNPTTLFHAAWALVMSVMSDKDEALYETSLRSESHARAEDEGTIGVSTHKRQLHVRLKDESVTALLAQIQRELGDLVTRDQSDTTSTFRPSEPSFPLAVSVEDREHSFAIKIDADRPVDPDRVAAYLETALRGLLDRLENEPQTQALSISILPESERHRVITAFNDDRAPYPSEKLVHELFEDQVRRTPQSAAVEYAGRSLTYLELNKKANQLARHLVNRGVDAGQIVGVALERSLEMVIALLGILKAGGAYLPLDPNYPVERLDHMLRDAAPPIVLTQEELQSLLPATSAEMVLTGPTLKQIDGHIDENLSATELGLTSHNRVYVIYTSGSTGQPKGTAMGHHSMVNLIEWHRRTFRPSAGQRVLQFAALSFDVAFQETFSTLCTGGTLVMLSEWIRRDVRALCAFITDQQIHRLFIPPLMLQNLAECVQHTKSSPTSLREIITAGEQLRITTPIVKLFQSLDGCSLHNHYGPTETHVVTALTLTGDPESWPALPTIGRPISNAQIYVLNGDCQPVPIGAPGEIYIGGAAVSQGYLNRPDMTAQRFVTDPYSPESLARLYKTGDVGRWRPDGTLEYLGRNDDQVKIRGFRIELGEIEAHLERHGQVKEAAVVARENPTGVKQLIAYVIPRDLAAAPSAQELRAHLAASLPAHMVPSAFVLLEALPLTPNGKLDKRALPPPQIDAYASREYEAPRGEVEQALAQVWQEQLGVERVGRHDNFFELGGHSLHIVQIIERLRHVGFVADAPQFFKHTTLAELASTLSRGGPEELQIPPNTIPLFCDAITPDMLPLVKLSPEHIDVIVQSVPGGARNIQDIYPLTPLQEGMLFHHLLHAQGRDAYARPILLSLSSRERLNEFVNALKKVAERHDILRTAVLWEHLPQPVQVVQRHATLPVEELVLDPNRDPVEQLEQRMSLQPNGLDLRQAPLMKLQVAANKANTKWYALIQTHHLLFDNESLQTMLAEAASHLEHRTHELPVPIPYRTHVAQALSHTRSRDAEAYFRSKLATVDETTAPFGLVDVHQDGSCIQKARQPLEPTLAARVRALARKLNVTAATLFHAVWALVVSRTSGRSDVVFGTLLLGRLYGAVESRRSLGMFINMLPLRLPLESLTAKELVDLTHQELGELLHHEHTPLVVAQRCSAIPAAAPLFSSLLNYLHNTIDFFTEKHTIAAGVQALALHEWTNYPVVLTIDDRDSEFVLTAETDRRVDPKRVLEYVHTAMHTLAEALEKAPHTPASQLTIVPDSEWHQVIDSFNATERNYPREKLIHELFEEQTESAPNAVAAVYECQHLTYTDLNAKANQLARLLREGGMQTGESVPILMARGFRPIIAQLAVLKNGGVYVPIDPELPVERQAFMIRDCGAQRVLTEKRPRAGLPQDTVQWINCSHLDAPLGITRESNPKTPLRRPCPAYVMYTSGSTGLPKGVIVPHEAVIRLVINTNYVQIEPDDCFGHCSNTAFDAATFEIWGALLNGARVLVLPQRVVLDPKAFAAAMLHDRVTVLFLTVGLFNQYAETLAPVFSGLRYLLTGGDVVDPSVLRRVLRHSPPDHLINAYGPTECTTFSTTYLVQTIEEDAGSVPIGKPISNARAYILDDQLQPVPIGAPGHLYIGGAGIALGYLNRPELTAERFIRDPFTQDPQARLYKTGDRACWRADGNIDFLGRSDQQVKLRGFRIELGEIEAQLARHAQVKEVAVLAREDTPGERRLVAYIVGRANNADAPTADDLRTYLRPILPEYMIPSAFVFLDRLPLTPNGKLDRRTLPAPVFGTRDDKRYEPPQGQIEQTLARIWQELLHVERVGRQDNFFELGGHSLIATRVITHISHQLDVDLPISVMFERPTIEALCHSITQRVSNATYRGIM